MNTVTDEQALDKRPRRPSAGGEIACLQPYPDELMDQLPDRREGPEDAAPTKETVTPAFNAAIRHLDPLPRAVLVLRDVLGCSARDTALLHENVRFSMPPTPGVWAGRSAVVQGRVDGGFGSGAFGSLRCALTRASGRPAVAACLRQPGDAVNEPPAIDVLRVRDGAVTEIITFDGAVFGWFGRPAALEATVGAA